ncbi:MAG: methyltransferase domain-containing protein [Gemmatimonadota bacterium]
MSILSAIRRLLPASLGRLWSGSTLRRVGDIDAGDLRRMKPISSNWGFDRGLPIDRAYIQRFLRAHESDVQGAVLEIGEDKYTRQFGGDRVTMSEVLAPSPGPGVTLIGDLSRPDDFGTAQFDCVLLIQTLPFIFDTGAVVRSVHQLLRPGGVVLATTPGITRIAPERKRDYGHYWSFTRASAALVFGQVFGSTHVETTTFGNVLSAVAFLQGHATEDLTPDELSFTDPYFEVTIGIRAIRADD